MTTRGTGRAHEEDDHDGPGTGESSTGTFDALGHRFSVASEDARMLDLVEESFAVLAACEPPQGWYHVRRHGDFLDVAWKGTHVGAASDCAEVLSFLRLDVQRRAVAAADADLVLRAGCVELDGRALVVSGASGCGVSTLLAALVAEGCTYMNDDAIPVELQSGRVRPFPQPLLLDDRALDLLPEIAPVRSGRHSKMSRRLVAMQCHRPRPDDALREVSIVLFPERDDSGITMMQRVDHDAAVVKLAQQAYNFPGHEAAAIETIHSLIRGADTYAVVGGDPHTSARAVLDVLATAPVGPAAN